MGSLQATAFTESAYIDMDISMCRYIATSTCSVCWTMPNVFSQLSHEPRGRMKGKKFKIIAVSASSGSSSHLLFMLLLALHISQDIRSLCMDLLRKRWKGRSLFVAISGRRAENNFIRGRFRNFVFLVLFAFFSGLVPFLADG